MYILYLSKRFLRKYFTKLKFLNIATFFKMHAKAFTVGNLTRGLFSKCVSLHDSLYTAAFSYVKLYSEKL
jgi:hypothetical protein